MDGAVYVHAALGWLALIFALRLIEPPMQKMASGSHIGNMGVILKHLLYDSAVLRLVFLALGVWSLTTFYAVWLLQRLWVEQGVELVHFGYLWGGLAIVTSLAGRWAHLVEDRLGSSAMLLLMGLAPALGYLGLSVTGAIGAVLVSVTFWVARGFGLVILRDALNSRVPSEFRATANSLASFAFRGAFVVTGPLVGWVFDLWGMQVTLLMLAAVTLVIFVVLIVPLMVAARESAQVAAAAVDDPGLAEDCVLADTPDSSR
jgi:predicted MFS family arabinose efflux permease